MNTRARKAVGCFVLLAYLASYAAGAMTLGSWLLPRTPQWLLLVYFAVTGLAWVAPLRPLFRWMNRGPARV